MSAQHESGERSRFDELRGQVMAAAMRLDGDVHIWSGFDGMVHASIRSRAPYPSTIPSFVPPLWSIEAAAPMREDALRDLLRLVRDA